MNKIIITNALLIDPADKMPRKSTLYIADGIIAALDQPPAGFTADITLDAKNQWVCPGLCDLSAHVGEPGLEHELRTATIRGITTLCCPPSTSPVIDQPEIVLSIQQRALLTQQSKVAVLGALTQNLEGCQLAPMAALKQAGCVGFSHAKKIVQDTRVLYHAFAYAKTVDLPVLLYAQDFWLTQDAGVHDGRISARLGLHAIPASAETIGVSRALALQKATGVTLHLSHISSGESVALIAEAQKQGQAVTADVAIHHLYLTDLDIDTFNSNCLVQPPLRSVADQQALLSGIQQGVITAICSDHTPLESTEKLHPFLSCTPGISGLDTFLSLLLGLQSKLTLTPNQLIKLATMNPAHILNLPQGTLNIGAPADIIIVNPDTNWTLTPDKILSQGKNTPFIDWPLQGQVQTTIVGGNVVYNIRT